MKYLRVSSRHARLSLVVICFSGPLLLGTILLTGKGIAPGTPTREAHWELYSASTRPYDGLPEVAYPFHDRDVFVTA
jgi:hypothetical protein